MITPLFLCLGTGTWEDPAPTAYEFTLLVAFAHSFLHPLSLLLLHHPLRTGLRQCLVEWSCCICLWLGIEFEIAESPKSERGSRHRVRDHPHQHPHHELNNDNHPHSFSRPHSRSHSPHQAMIHRSAGDLVHIPGAGSLKMMRTTSLKSDRLLLSTGCGTGEPPSPPINLTDDDMLPPPPLPPATKAFRKQVCPSRVLHCTHCR